MVNKIILPSFFFPCPTPSPLKVLAVLYYPSQPWLHYTYMLSLQQIIDDRISFLREQINPQNKPEENKTLQLQINAIRSAAAAAAANDIEEVEAIIAEKKALLKNSNDVYEFDRLSTELEGLEWLQRQIARLFWG